MLVSFVLHGHTCLELNLTSPVNIVQISSGSTGASLSQDSLINLYPRLQPFRCGTVVVSKRIPDPILLK